MRDDIPLQTPMGSYNPSWLRQNRWWLLLLAITALAMYGGAVAVTCLGEPQPITLAIDIVPSESLPLEVRPKRLHHAVSVKDWPSSQEFELSNRSDSPLKPRFSLKAHGLTAFSVNNLQLVNLTVPDGVPQLQPQGPVALTNDLRTIAFVLEVLRGLSGDGFIAPHASATFRLTATNSIDQADDEHFLVLLISQSP